MDGLAVLDQLVRHGDGRVGRYGEPDVLGTRLTRRQVGDVYTDDPAFAVCKGPSRVARGDRCVGLDQVVQGCFLHAARVLGRHLTPRATDNAGCDRGLEARWAADRDRHLADDRVPAREARCRQVVAVHSYHSDIRRRVRAYDLAALYGPVGEGDFDIARALHHVIVGDDVAVGAVDHTAPYALFLLRPERGLSDPRDVDLDDRRAQYGGDFGHGFVGWDVGRGRLDRPGGLCPASARVEVDDA